jgi:hypothetical protein
LFEAVHALANFDVHPPVGRGAGLQRVLLDDLVGNDDEGKSHVFIPLHRSHCILGNVPWAPLQRFGAIPYTFSCSRGGP